MDLLGPSELEHCQRGSVQAGHDVIEAVFLRRTDSLADEPSNAVAAYIRAAYEYPPMTAKLEPMRPVTSASTSRMMQPIAHLTTPPS